MKTTSRNQFTGFLARSYGRSSFKASIWGPFVGQLLLRTIDRSRRINMDLARRLCTRAILMDRGAITFDGPIDILPYPLIMGLQGSYSAHQPEGNLK